MIPSPLHFHRSFHLTKIFFSNSIDFYQNKFVNMTKFVKLFCIYFNSMDFGQRSLFWHSIKLRKKRFPFKNVLFIPIWIGRFCFILFSYLLNLCHLYCASNVHDASNKLQNKSIAVFMKFKIDG